MTRQVQCINKHPTHQDRHRRIEAVGGVDGSVRWKDSEDTAIANVKRDRTAYFVSEQGTSVWVIVRVHEGREYLKTTSDLFLADNLLSLPECP